MSHPVTPRTERIDFRATSDPALHERIAPSERVARMSGQIADEARHAPSRRFCRSPRAHCGA